MQAEQLATNAELQLDEQAYGQDPIADRETDLYRGEYIMSFVEKWDELIDWDARADSEGQFFMDVLRARGKETVLDVATGTGFHSVRLTRSGFNVTSADGSAAMLAKAFQNGQKRGMILKTVQADWRWLNRDIQGKYDAIICLGNSFTHLHDELDRRRALAEFYAALKHDGILIIDQRNYDAMLDQGYSNKHKYYYAGKKVKAEPVHMDEGLARFKYSFPDGAEYTLNMCPIRKNYMRRLLSEAGFERVRTYGDFQETFAENDPDFFIHIAEKSSLQLVRWGGARPEDGSKDIREVAESYYDSDDADTFYSLVWGGQDLHIGLYDETSNIREASDLTIDEMAGMLPNLGADAKVLDIGSGYGGAMRKLVKASGCSAVCLNISDVQNDTNRHRNIQQGFKDRIRVQHGVFEDIPEQPESFEIVWSQDAILHSDQRHKVLQEVYRVLKPGGYFIFTDPMQADDADPKALQPVYDRLQLNSLGSMRFYRETAESLGFETVEQRDMTQQLRNHYFRVREELLANYDKLRNEGASAEYLDKMSIGLMNWVNAADAGQLAWGIQLFRKPA
ncbi:putative glycine-sarcosine methyltransferase [Stappia aggregata IAM 12614]|uniref:Putative glycine-sarcosine methyltransferase n=1 Tax=Roseibium aggregatum (strain ATCC 25650 / DSM 13394 / JCM 20685 / NBRC 16684 / NCIMB 2208 / IAM 12614 / B1) TaxID=384765 RepID=A0NW22_ROSAI|nr:methyltransferase domain-containing protein [Roseibium aggregatum]EAV43187.1 putative glycine-sarcosine methyltransferase [Stappia aggregata IAM 12614] [Roseibium aggregatum IAM 12614]